MNLKRPNFLRSKSAKAGLVLCVLTVVVAIAGPFVSPYPPAAIVGGSFANPSSAHLLGTDELGRDVLSRFLNGGGTIIAASLAATLLSYIFGTIVGIFVGLRRGISDLVFAPVVDILLAFPPLVLVLLLVTGLGAATRVAVFGIALAYTPRVARIVRAATQEVAVLEFVEAAMARGEPIRRIIIRDVLRNIWTPISADAGLRLTGAIILFGSLCYLGLGPAPPAANWALMISENRDGLTYQPWPVIVPAVTLGLLAIGANLVADAAARSVGRSVETRD